MTTNRTIAIESDQVFYQGHQARFERFQPFSGAGVLPGSCDGVGVHFGSLESARDNGFCIAAVTLNVRNAIYLPDMGDWNSELLAFTLVMLGLLTDKQADFASDLMGKLGKDEANSHIVAKLVAAGYDGFVYESEFAGEGPCVTAFSPAQVLSLNWVC